ncbi:MAG: hypothetical protein R3Y68_03760 [Rikenellaceae bacterium]
MAIDNRIKSNVVTVVIALLLAATYLANVGVLEIPQLPLAQLSWAQWLVAARDHAPTALERWMLEWQSSHPTWALLLSMSLLLGGAIYTMRLTIKHNLFGAIIHIPSILYAALMIAIITPAQMILAPFAGVIMIMSLRKIYDAYTSDLSSPKIFSGCFWIGVIPLIYPSSLPLVALFLPVMVVLERGGRELLLAVWAIVTPATILLYAAWLFGVDTGELLGTYWGSLMGGEYALRCDPVGLALILLSGIMAVVTVGKIDTISISIIARQRIIYTMTIVVCSLLAIALPSFRTATFAAAAAAPVAILATTLFLELKTRWATLLYLIFVVLTILSAGVA